MRTYLDELLDIEINYQVQSKGRLHPKGFNKYTPHQGKQEIARRYKQDLNKVQKYSFKSSAGKAQ